MPLDAKYRNLSNLIHKKRLSWLTSASLIRVQRVGIWASQDLYTSYDWKVEEVNDLYTKLQTLILDERQEDMIRWELDTRGCSSLCSCYAMRTTRGRRMDGKFIDKSDPTQSEFLCVGSLA